MDIRTDTTSAPAPPAAVLGAAFDDEREEMLPGYGPACEEGSTWEMYQDDGTYPPWL